MRFVPPIVVPASMGAMQKTNSKRCFNRRMPISQSENKEIIPFLIVSSRFLTHDSEGPQLNAKQLAADTVESLRLTGHIPRVLNDCAFCPSWLNDCRQS